MVLYGNNLSQVTDIRATDKSPNSLWGRRGERGKGRFPASLEGLKAQKVVVTHVTTFTPAPAR